MTLQDLARTLKRLEGPEIMVRGVESLEQRQKAARERLENLLKAVDSDPSGTETDPTSILTNQVLILNRIP